MLALREERTACFSSSSLGGLCGPTGSIVFYRTYCGSTLKSQSIGVCFPLSLSLSFFLVLKRRKGMVWSLVSKIVLL